MQVQSVNNRAKNKYYDFETAMRMIAEALQDSSRLLRRMRESHAGFASWQVPDKKEITAAHQKAVKRLEALQQKAAEYEAELMSRGWRV